MRHTDANHYLKWLGEGIDTNMKREKDLKEGFYFVHGYYWDGISRYNKKELYRNHMILIKDNFEDVYDIDAYDIDLIKMKIDNFIPPGEFVYYRDKYIKIAEKDSNSIVYSELNKQLIKMIGYEHYGNQPKKISGIMKDVYSYHINVGHGNCSIIVYYEKESYHMMMIDCSIFDFTNRQNYATNLNECMEFIYRKYRVSTISKLLITHLHYDHINGIEYLIKTRRITKETEVWMNTQYPWKQPSYNRILLQLKALGIRFIDPIVSNSTENINVLYPDISFNKKNKAPKNNINNASVLYQVCLNGKSMLFTGDIEYEGWEKVSTCKPYLCQSSYYCISHHGSITGHIRDVCIPKGRVIETVKDCAKNTKLQILMGRDNAYSGIYNSRVLSDFYNVIKTEDAEHYIEINWNKIELKNR